MSRIPSKGLSWSLLVRNRWAGIDRESGGSSAGTDIGVPDPCAPPSSIGPRTKTAAMSRCVRLPLPGARGEAPLPVLPDGRGRVIAGRGQNRCGRIEPQGTLSCALSGSSNINPTSSSTAAATRSSTSSSRACLNTMSSSSTSFNPSSSSSRLSSSNAAASHNVGSGSTRRRSGLGVVCMAKGGKEKKGAKKGSGIPKRGPAEEAGAATAPPVVPYTQGEIIMHSLELIDSYFRAVGKPIFSEPVEIASAAKALWDADFVVMSHGTEEDPVFNYGNQKALDLFETTWEEFTRMPSRKSASDATQANRNDLLASAKAGAKDLKGILRVTTKGREFEVDEGVLWTLVASDGENFGQAAVFRQWHFPGEEAEETKEGEAKEGETKEGITREGETGPTTDGSPSGAEEPAGAASEVAVTSASAPLEGAEASSGAP